MCVAGWQQLQLWWACYSDLPALASIWFYPPSAQQGKILSRCPTEVVEVEVETLEDGARAGEFYRNLILSEAFQSPSLSSSYQRILFVDIPGLSRLIRSWEWVFYNSWYRLASPPTWRGGKPRSWWRPTPGSWWSTTIRGPSSLTSIRGKFSVAKIECFAKTKYFSIFPSPQCCVEIWETPSQRSATDSCQNWYQGPSCIIFSFYRDLVARDARQRDRDLRKKRKAEEESLEELVAKILKKRRFDPPSPPPPPPSSTSRWGVLVLVFSSSI